jgi:hypothetical protein
LLSVIDAAIPCLPKKFPARPSREFGVQVTENAGKISLKNRPRGAFLAKFPAKFPASREFWATTGEICLAPRPM